MNNNLTISRFFLAIKRGILEIIVFTLVFFGVGNFLARFFVATEYRSTGELQLVEGINTVHPSNVQSIMLSSAVINNTYEALTESEVLHEDGTPIILADLEGHFSASIDSISVKVAYVNTDSSITKVVMQTYLNEGKEYLDQKYPAYKIFISQEASDTVIYDVNKKETILLCTLFGLLTGFVISLLKEALADKLYSKNEIVDIKMNILNVNSLTKKIMFLPIQQRALKCSTETVVSFKNNLELLLAEECGVINLLTPRYSIHGVELAKELASIISSHYQEKTLILDLDFTSDKLIKLMGVDEDSDSYKAYKEGNSQIINFNENLDVIFYPISSISSKYIIGHEFETFMEEAKAKYKHIIIVNSPVLTSYDHMALTKFSKCNLLIIKKDETIRKDIYDSLDILNKRNVNMHAIVYVDVIGNFKALGYVTLDMLKKLGAKIKILINNLVAKMKKKK